MENSISSRLAHAWNALFNRAPTYRPDYGGHNKKKMHGKSVMCLEK